MKQAKAQAQAFISVVVLLAGSAAFPVVAADPAESVKTISTVEHLGGGWLRPNPVSAAGSLIRDISTGIIPGERW